MINIIPTILAFLVVYLPFYILANYIFKKHKFVLSFALCFITLIYLGFILQFLRFFHGLIIIAICYIILILIIRKKVSISAPNKKILSLFVLVFVLASLPLFFTQTFPIEGDDITFHTYLVKIILEKKTVLTSWGILNEKPIIYPFGIHLIASTLTLNGMIPITDVLFTLFPLLFAVFCVSIYPLAREFGLDKQKSLLCIILIGFGSLFALFPLVWGGIAQLFGMVMLNFTFYFMIRYANNKNSGNLILYMLSMGVLFLAYYWMFVIFCVGMVCLWLKDRTIILDTLKGFLGLIIISPWIYVIACHMMGGLGFGVFIHPQPPVPIIESLFVINPLILILAFYSFEKKHLPFYIWVVLSIILLFSQHWLGMHIFNPSRWLYSLSIPLSLLASIGFFKIYKKINKQAIYVIFVVGLMLISTSYYMYQSLIKYPGISEEDWITINYIKANISENKTIYAVGRSGTWIPFITDKPIMNPMLSSMAKDKEYIENEHRLRQFYKEGKLTEIGADYYFISIKESVSEDCNEVYKRLFKCS